MDTNMNESNTSTGTSHRIIEQQHAIPCYTLAYLLM